MSAVPTIKAGSTVPPLRAVLTDTDTGEPIDLTNATQVQVTLHRMNRAALISGTCTIDSPPTAGAIRYTWADEDLVPGNFGLYVGEFRITFSDNNVRKVPNEGFFKFRLAKSLTE